jgi:predicted peroxiredoxin
LSYAKVGDYNIKKICQLEKDEKSVYKYYKKCMEMGIVFMVDMFSLENRYCLTPQIHKYVGKL